MKAILALFLALACSDWVEPPDAKIPDKYISVMKQTDYIEVTGLDLLGHEDDFTIHSWKPIKQFVDILSSEIYVPAAKSIDPQFKSKSRYHIKLFAKGQPIMTFDVVGFSVLDIPGDDQYYMESDRHSLVLVSPLCMNR